MQLNRTIPYISTDKKKRKEAAYISYTSAFLFFPAYKSMYVNTYSFYIVLYSIYWFHIWPILILYTHRISWNDIQSI